MEITLITPSETYGGNIQFSWDQLSQETAEALIAELYRADCLTFAQAQSLLHHASWQETARVLKQHGCELYYDRDDFDHDLETLGIPLTGTET
jgi:predicted HTH domain antitoxin